jgi:hypothetical protein
MLAKRTVVDYQTVDGAAGTLIDPDGSVSAVHTLRWRYGQRLDLVALLRTFQARERAADREAATLIRRILADAQR